MNDKFESYDYKLDPNKWLDTLPARGKNNIDTTFKFPSIKYYLTIILFIIGLISVSVIKNETRNLQKEISNLRASINSINRELHQTVLDHVVITSPENIEELAQEYLEHDFIPYKKDQIKNLNENEKIIASTKITKKNKIKKIIKEKAEEKRVELAKLKEIYEQPKKLPGEIKLQLSKKIEAAKFDLKKIYENPSETITSDRMYKWAGIQVVKVFLGIPVIPGR